MKQFIKFIKWLINCIYVLIFHYDMMFTTYCNEQLGEYVPIGDDQIYILNYYDGTSLVVFKKYLLWK